MAAGEDLATEIGAAIRTACKEACLTQQQLGELSGLSDRTIRDIETGTGAPACGQTWPWSMCSASVWQSPDERCLS